MKKLTAADPETKSTDIKAENLAALRSLFPELITEGPDGVAVNLDVLKQIVGDHTFTDAEEKYGLNWHGKRRARQLALTPSTGTLRPCLEDSENWDTTQNLMIEGDNLEVLKLLQKSYAGKVKLIYIDPPYNTGKDFVYPDNFQDNIKNYMELTGQIEGGQKISTNSESSGRFHTDWLNMMYPRLKLARNLLASDGVIFVTLDDTEVSNLRLLMDEIFGTECFAGSVAWKKRSSPDARDTLGSVHDWILVYVKNVDRIKSAIGKMALSKERIDSYENPDSDSRGPWASVDMTGMTGRATAEQYFEVLLPSGRKVQPPEGRSWGLSKATYDELLNDGRIWFGKTGDGVPRIKRFLSESDGQVVPTFWDMSEVGSNEEAKKELNRLMGKADVFDTPKPIRLIQRMLEIGTTKNKKHIALDFFAGSGTTAHAVMKHNSENSDNVTYILVQLPEPLDESTKSQTVSAAFCKQLGKPQKLSELTKQRLRLAIKDVEKDSNGSNTALGFRVFKLDSTNVKAWDPKTTDVSKQILELEDHIKEERSEEDLYFEVILKLGLDLSVASTVRSVEGHKISCIGEGVLFTCLSRNVSAAQIEKLSSEVIRWRNQLMPAGVSKLVLRSDAFVDDVTKLNLVAMFEQVDDFLINFI